MFVCVCVCVCVCVSLSLSLSFSLCVRVRACLRCQLATLARISCPGSCSSDGRFRRQGPNMKNKCLTCSQPASAAGDSGGGRCHGLYCPPLRVATKAF